MQPAASLLMPLQVFVPTPETVSLRFFLDMMATLKKPIMFVGGPGTVRALLCRRGAGRTLLLALQYCYQLHAAHLAIPCLWCRARLSW